jgi:hypothetical protein
MAKSVEDAKAAMFRNLEEKTGKSIAEWVKIARGSGLAKHKDLTTFLKAKHGLTHGYANQIALKALQSDDAPPAGDDALVTAQYAGGKAALKPIYDALVKALRGFGKDVEISPKKAYVSVRRSKQFAIIQPSTATRVDIGINLKGEAASGRLETSGGFNAMVSHRVRVTNAKEIDSQLVEWLRRAYDAA